MTKESRMWCNHAIWQGGSRSDNSPSDFSKPNLKYNVGTSHLILISRSRFTIAWMQGIQYLSLCLCLCVRARMCVCDLESLRSGNHTCNTIWAVTSRSDNPHFNFGKLNPKYKLWTWIIWPWYDDPNCNCVNAWTQICVCVTCVRRYDILPSPFL
jgi:hypothetical protein